MRSFAVAALLLGGSGALFASSDTDLLALVPANAKMVSSIDVARTRSTGFGQFLFDKLTSDDGMKEFIRDMGFDPRQDLQTVIFASTGSDDNGEAGFVGLARGAFDEAKVESAALKKGGQIQHFLGLNVIVAHPNQAHGAAIAFPLNDVMLVGDIDAVHSVIQNRASPSLLDTNLQHRIDEVSSNNDAWFASANGGFLAHHLALEANGKHERKEAPLQALSSITQSSGGIRFGDVNQLQFDAIARSPKDATSVADVVRFFASMVQMQREKDPRAGILASSFDAMNIKTSGDTVNVNFSIPEKDLERLAQVGLPVSAGSRHPSR